LIDWSIHSSESAFQYSSVCDTIDLSVTRYCVICASSVPMRDKQSTYLHGVVPIIKRFRLI